MAIANSDGSIMLSVAVDKETLEKALKGVENSGKKLNSTFSKIGTTIAKGFTLAATAAATAVAKMVKDSVAAYGEYEQLVGGVETLFKGAAQKVIDYANDAFYTAGVSANEYMQQVTSFSASLISSCAGDTDKAADIANMALIDISDNVNKMGSTMESVTLAYQGFAKQQYMLLDNLKLGYGGTKTEMERLLKDAQAITGVKYDIDNLADVYNALHVIQEQLGITGTTAKEAEETIQGPANMMKASWENVIAAISGGGDIDRAINNLVYSITKYFDNIVPVVQRALIGVGQLIEGIAPLLAQNVATAIIQSIPSLINAIYAMFIGAAKGIWNGIKAIFTGNSGGGTVTAQLKTTASGAGAIADNLGTAADNQDALTKGVKGTNKELKKTLAGFDELQILSDTSTSAGGASGGTGASSGGGIGGASVELPEISGEEDKVDVNPWKSAIKGLAEVLVGTGLIALGIILLTKGNIKWGLGAIIFGLMSIGAGVATLGEAFDASKAKDMILIITGITGELLITIGVILLALGSKAMGAGAIIGGLALLGYTAAELGNGLEVSEIMSTLSTLMAFLGGVLLAIGVFLCWIGGPKEKAIGIKCIIAGVIALVGSGALGAAGDMGIEDWLLNLQIIAGGFLLVLGIMILMTGFSPVGLGLVIAGAVVLSVALMNKSNAVPEEVKKWVNIIFAIVSAVALVIGIIMLCCGVVSPLSIGLIVVGAIGLASEIAINYNAVKDSVTKFFNDNAALIVGIAIALVVIGIILCFTGVALPLGIGLIVAGAAAIGSEIALHWDAIKTKVSEIIDAIKNWIEIYGMLVLGIILCLTGAGIPLGIKLIVDWCKDNYGEVEIATAIVDKVKEIWGNVKGFWNDNIKQIFTQEWWLNLAKTCGNGLISGFESTVNGVIGLYEKMINFIVKGLNKISIDIPEWVPSVGGKTFGFNLKEVNLGRVSIPPLAQGAVIPANREFLAVLGDQKHGTNIEAPAELIKQMAKEAYQEMGLANNQQQQIIKEEHYNLNQTELMTIVYKLVKGGERLNGTSLVKQGGI